MAVKKQRKGKKFTIKMQKKLLLVFLLAAAALIILSIILIRTNLRKGEAYSKSVYDNFTYDSRTIPARRGDITDRNGTILAYSTKVYNLIIDAKVLLSEDEYRTPTVKALLKYFDLDSDELNAYIDDNAAKKSAGTTVSSYKRLLTGLTDEEIEGFQAEMEDNNNIKGIWFEEEYERNYPNNSLAADLIGFSSEANGGELGIESQYERYLAGIDGRKYGYIDNSAYESNVINPVNGDTVVSTIDYKIQSIIEKALYDFNSQYGSESSAVLVMDPNNGEILGMADYPSFDLNNPRDLSSIYTTEEYAKLSEKEQVEAMYKVWSNYCVSSIYEPGSVFKTFTVAEALEEKLYSVTDVFNCDGKGVYDNSTILCHGGEGHGDLTLAGTLTESCNDALMQIGEKIGIPTFSKYLTTYKFGEKTGIDLPSEENGLTINESKMMDVDLATNSFGQNINVTMVQMAATFASVINGGNYYEPHVVKELQSASGETVKTFEPVLVTQTVSAQTSRTMRAFLRAVVDYGTGGYVYLDGYSIGGKTGTAEKQPRDKENYVVSFMGFAPAEDPQVLVYVVIDTPDCEENDTSWAAQMVSRQIFGDLLPYMGITPDNPDYEVEVTLDPENKTTIGKREPTGNIGDTSIPIPPEDADSDSPTSDNLETETSEESESETETPEEAKPEETVSEEPPPEEVTTPPEETE